MIIHIEKRTNIREHLIIYYTQFIYSIFRTHFQTVRDISLYILELCYFLKYLSYINVYSVLVLHLVECFFYYCENIAIS